MKRITVLLLAFTMFGCSIEQGSPDQHGNFEEGNTGGVGPMGPAGPAGPAGGLRWRDASGAQIDGAVLHGMELVFVDDAGLLWKLDAETGLADVAAGELAVKWTNADCSGAPFVAAPPPRFTFRIAGDTGVRVRADNVVAYDVTIASAQTESGCAPLAQPVAERLISLPAALGTGVPELTFVGPLHPERP